MNLTGVFAFLVVFVASVRGQDAPFVTKAYRAATYLPQLPISYSVETQPFGVYAQDFNNDGKKDLVSVNIGSDSISVLMGNGDGSFQSAVNYIVGDTPRLGAVGDVSGDG